MTNESKDEGSTLAPLTYSIPIYLEGEKTEQTFDGIIGDENYLKILQLRNGEGLPDIIDLQVKK